MEMYHNSLIKNNSLLIQTLSSNHAVGYWNHYYGSKRPEGKQVKWQLTLSKIAVAKRQPNLDNILPKPPNYYNMRKANRTKPEDWNESKKIAFKGGFRMSRFTESETRLSERSQ